MSYSFTFRARTIAAAIAIAASELDKVVESQPIHAHDRKAAMDAVQAQVELIAPHQANGHHVCLSVCGSLGWTGSYPDAYELTSANTSVNAWLVAEAVDGGAHLPTLREAP